MSCENNLGKKRINSSLEIQNLKIKSKNKNALVFFTVQSMFLLASVFQNKDEIFLIDYLKQGGSITGPNYTELTELRNKIIEKRRGKLAKVEFFL